ncbi:sodium-dependent phosphate transporter 1-A-like isoform X1 [Periplaneta americana]|uniref:sodium-dependent phosphate transporter 1-A-like isoform X1 n=1 Tax=Periplaneta americana TaxID=6978 RepID=UPI0037E84A22
MIEAFSTEVLWIVIVGFIMAFVLAFGIGANDVANSFGTSVGSKVLTIRQACCLATVFEIAGAMLIGYKVSDTMRKGILQVDVYEGAEKELMLGMFAALIGSTLLLLGATFFKLPVSATHSIVGATIGFSLVCRGDRGLNWETLGMIIGSWFVSPVLSGLISVILFVIIRRFILNASNPLVPGLLALPVFYGVTIFVNVFSIVHDGPTLLYFDRIPWWGALLISLGIAAVAMLIVQFLVVPYMKRQINQLLETLAVEAEVADAGSEQKTPDGISFGGLKKKDAVYIETNELGKQSVTWTNSEKIQPNNVTNDLVQTNGTTNNQLAIPNGDKETPPPSNTPNLGQDNPAFSTSPDDNTTQPQPEEKDAKKDEAPKEDPPEVGKLFSFLQILTATFASFAHGGNDVSNAIGPLIALWLIYTEGSVQQKSETPLYILFYGGVGISVGLWLWGRRVIQTIGEDLTKITPSTGFTIEIGAALTVLLASKIGLPISTTHCKVGSIVFVGWTSSTKQGVDWKLFRNIIGAWCLTVPLSGGLSAAAMAILREVAI